MDLSASTSSDSESEGHESLHHHGKFSPRKASYGRDAIRALLRARPQALGWYCYCTKLAEEQRKVGRSFQTGVVQLGVATSESRDGLIYVPRTYDASKPSPMAVLLHGAGGTARQAINLLRPLADSAKLLLLAPESRGRTWDIILHTYGPDVAFIDKALERMFERYCVDQNHVAIGGFSDGASYALSLGIPNGLMFSHILAFSPGFMRPPSYQDSPQIFISHGTRDAVLNIDHCSRRIVPRLRAEGYTVVYQEFNGGHSVPDEIAKEAMSWFLMPKGHTQAPKS